MSLVNRNPVKPDKLYTRYLGTFLYVEFPFNFDFTLCVNADRVENNFEEVDRKSVV